MLTSSGPYLNIETSPGETILASVAGLLFLFMILAVQNGVDWDLSREHIDSASEGNTLRTIGMSLLGLRPDLGAASSGQLHTGYLLPFEIISVHLLVVLVGAAYLARAKRRRNS